MELTDSALRQLPKVELHRHLDGSVRLQTMWELARRHGLDLGAASLEELRARATLERPLGSLREVLARFALVQRVLCSYEALEQVAFENVEDAWRDGVRLLELRFAPSFIAAGKEPGRELGHDEIIEAVLDGVERGAARYPLEVGLIGILPRSAAPAANVKVTEDLLRHARSRHPGAWRLVGFDLADDEERVPPETFVPLVSRARAAGLGITVHSGENTDAACVRRSLELFRPRRVGHGIRAWDDRKLVAELRARDVLLELCPTSNWITASVPTLEAHPLPHLARAGVPVSINSDDPHLFGIDLVHEYELCARLYGFGLEDFRSINRAAAAHSFLPEERRRRAVRQYFS